MKNISLALNGVLIIAVAILYYLQFSTPSTAPEETEEENIEASNETKINLEEPSEEMMISSNIGYINVDSLQGSYKLYEELINKLKAKQARYEREMNSKATAFDKKMQDFRQKAPTMTQFEGELKQQELAKEQEKLYKMRDDFAAQFQNEEAKMNDQFQKKVKDFIVNHNKTTDYDIIIGSSQMGNIVLDYKKGIDITNTVVKGLNEQYQAEKSETKK